MTCNIENMLNRCAEEIGPKWGYNHDLRQLAQNLKELRDRHRAGDTTAIDEFFDLYTFSEVNHAD